MKRIIPVMSLIILFFTSVMFGQTTVSIPDLNSNPGEVLVPVSTGSLTDVGSITIDIEYDTNVLEFNPEGLEDSTQILNTVLKGSGFLNVNENAGVISVGWFDLTSIDISGKLFDIKFNYLGGSSDLAFTRVEITDGDAQPYQLNVVDGSIGPFPSTLKLGTVISEGNEQVVVQLTGTNVSGAHSITLPIQYDPAVLTFVEIQNDAVGFTPPTPSNGQVTLAWFDQSNSFSIGSGVVAELVFDFTTGSSDLTFNSPEVTDINGTDLNVTYVDGRVSTPPPPVASLIMTNETALPGQEVEVKFKGLALENIGSFTFDVNYNPAVLDFEGVTPVAGGNFSVNGSVDGQVSVAYINPEGLDLMDGDIAIVTFTYLGGTTNITFNDAAAEVTDVDGNEVGTEYVDGSVSQVDVTAATIAEIQQPVDDTEYSQFDGEYVETTGQVTYVDPNVADFFHIQSEAALWSGIIVDMFNAEDGVDYQAQVGDEITIIAKVHEFGRGVYEFGSQTQLVDVYMVDVESTGNAPFEPVVAPVITDVKTEPYEALFAKVMRAIPLESGFASEFTDSNDVGSITAISDGDLIDDFDVTKFYDIEGYMRLDVVEEELIMIYVNADAVTDIDGGNGIESGIPSTYSLSQNYPNPFNPSTVISFSLPEQSNVTLKIYNVLGQEISTLLNTVKAAGTHQVEFDASQLTSGIYFYKLEASQFTSIKKMMLIK